MSDDFWKGFSMGVGFMTCSVLVTCAVLIMGAG